MAREKVVKLKVESNVKTITKEYEGLNQQVQKQDDIVEDTTKSYEKLDQSTSKYTKKTSKSYKKINEEGSKLKSNIDGAGKSFTAGTEAIGFYGDAMSLVGVESEKLEENLKLVDDAMRLGKGLEGVKEGVTSIKEFASSSKLAGTIQTAFTSIMGVSSGALKVFRLALIGTGIGALIVGVGLLIANFDKLLGVFQPVIDKLKMFSDFIGITNFEQEEAEKKREEEAKASEERHKAFIKQIKAEEKALDNKLKKEKEVADFQIQSLELQKRNAKSTEQLIAIEQAQSNQKLKLQEKEYEDFIEKQKLRIKKQEEQAKYLDGVVQRNIERGRKDHTGEVKRANELRASNKKIQEQIANDNFLVYQQIKQQRTLIENETEDAIAKIREDANDKYKAYRDRRLDAQRELLDRQINAEMIALETEKSMLQVQGEDILNIEQQIFDKQLEQAQINFEREYDDVLKNEDLTRKEKNAIREAMEKEWQETEKSMKVEHENDLAKIELDKAQEVLDAKAKLRQQEVDEETQFYLDVEKLESGFQDSELSDEQREINAVRDKYTFLLAMAEKYGYDTTELERGFQAQLDAITDKYINKRQNNRDKELKAEQELAMAKAQMGLNALNLVSQIATANAGDDVKRQEKAFKIKKATDIASATIDGYKAVISTYANTPGGVLLKSIASTIAGAFAIQQIQGIASQQFKAPDDSGLQSTASGGGGAGGGAGGGDIITPEFNIIGGAELNDTEGLGQQPLQAYVVSGDVTSAQSLDRNRIENATI